MLVFRGVIPVLGHTTGSLGTLGIPPPKPAVTSLKPFNPIATPDGRVTRHCRNCKRRLVQPCSSPDIRHGFCVGQVGSPKHFRYLYTSSLQLNFSYLASCCLTQGDTSFATLVEVSTLAHPGTNENEGKNGIFSRVDGPLMVQMKTWIGSDLGT